MKDERPIGIFDSGLGGLSVLKELEEEFPNENFVYVADTLRMPYGDREPNEIVEFARKCFKKLEELNVKAVIIACSTTTAFALDEMKNEFDFPILGIVAAGALLCSMETKNKNVLLLATNATVKSEIYEKKIGKIDSKINVSSIGCPDLVHAIEVGDEEGIYNTAKKYLDLYKNYNYDTLMLGCNQFPFAIDEIKNVLEEQGKNVNIINSAEAMAESLLFILEDLKMLSDKRESIRFFVTGDEDFFRQRASKILKIDRDKLDVIHF